MLIVVKSGEIRRKQMYLEDPSDFVTSTHRIRIKYDCHGEERWMKYSDAKKNFEKNNGKHICRKCWLKSDANPAKKKEVREKMAATNLKRHGTAIPMNKKENIEKRREQFKDEAFKEAWLEKHKQTSLEKYGVDHPMKTQEVQEKQKQTMQEKYGVDHPYQSQEIMAKMKANNLEKHGVENVAQLPEVRVKMAKTTMERYGVEHYNELPEMKDYLREHCKDWLNEAWANPWAKGIMRPEEWNEKQRDTISKLIELGEWKAGHKNSWHGYYSANKCKRVNPFFRSGFELLCHWHLDHDEQVEWYHYEPFHILYTKIDGTNGRYHPDFLVKYKQDSDLHLLEVKADYLHDSLEVKAKYESAIQYALSNGMKYRILLKSDIYAFNLDFDEIIKSDKVIVTHNPRL